jgi:exopolyphosphatase/guanosine-5'-triphosphate,3'-diphosphate pyrophosphatase
LAAVDVGSNTVHLLVATLADEGLVERLHAVEMLNLGREVTSHGRIGAPLIATVTDTVARMLDLARGSGAEDVGLVGTEAVRNAPDADQLVASVKAATSETLRILTGEAEARLSYLGATAFRVPAGEPATVADVGGGSTEVVQGKGTRPRNGTSLKLGSDQLLNLIKASDPPTTQQQVHAAARVSMILEAVPRSQPPGTLMATGGTASNVPVLLGARRPAVESARLSLREEAGEAWTHVDRSDLEKALELTMSRSSGVLAAATGLTPRRARLMAGGLVILVGLLDRYQADGLTVTERGLRDGVALALAAARARS